MLRHNIMYTCHQERFEIKDILVIETSYASSLYDLFSSMVIKEDATDEQIKEIANTTIASMPGAKTLLNSLNEQQL